MSQQHVNGHAAPEQPTPQEQMLRAQAQLDALLEPILGTTINGTLVTVQGLAPEQLAKAIARVTGKILGRIVQQGPLVSVLQVRSAMKEDFGKGIDATVPVPPPANAAPARPRG